MKLTSSTSLLLIFYFTAAKCDVHIKLECTCFKNASNYLWIKNNSLLANSSITSKIHILNFNITPTSSHFGDYSCEAQLNNSTICAQNFTINTKNFPKFLHFIKISSKKSTLTQPTTDVPLEIIFTHAPQKEDRSIMNMITLLLLILLVIYTFAVVLMRSYKTEPKYNSIHLNDVVSI